ncbi:MAG: nucleoside permease [Lentisphaerota bacterium]
MNLKIRIGIMLFLQFFVWGAWMPTMAAWWFGTKHWTGAEFGAVFSTMGIAAIFMPALSGIIADKWVNAERLYGIFHLIGALVMLCIPMVNDPKTMFIVMLVNMCFYMPTLGLSITVSYATMENAGMNIIKEYPPIRVFGTIGFILAMWTVSIMHFETSASMFYVAGIVAAVLGLYGLTMPKCPPLGKNTGTIWSKMGLDAFKLFKNPKMALFFIFTMLLGAALQLTNAYGDVFLHSFERNPIYKSCLAVKYPAIVMSTSQVAEIVFILAIPFFLRHFGIKKVMLMSMFAWVFRFGLLGFGDPAGGLWMILLSCIIYGMAFDFFNISGSLYVETQASPAIRASAQGLFMLMCNGIGKILGTTTSGWMIDKYFTEKLQDGQKILHWQGWDGIWMVFAAYALIVGILFAILFKHKHDPEALVHFRH